MHDDDTKAQRQGPPGPPGGNGLSAVRALEALLAQVRGGAVDAPAVAAALENVLDLFRPPAAPARRARVLLVEDDETSAAVMLHRLGREGIEVFHHTDGREVFPRLAETQVDLALLDVKAPGFNGFELLRRLRKDPRYLALPVILTAWPGDEQDLVRAFQLGADDYVLKPFSPIELTARVQRLLFRRPQPVGGRAYTSRLPDAEWHH